MSDHEARELAGHESSPAPERVILTDLIAELREVHRAGGQGCDMCRDGWPCWDETAVQRAEARLRGLDQAQRNLDLQTATLNEFGAVALDELEGLAGADDTPPELVVSWRNTDVIVAVPWHGATVIPGFQLDSTGRPIPQLQPILQALHGYGMGDWERALWWMIPNSALNDRRPVDLLPRISQPDIAAELMAATPHRQEWF